MAGHQQVGGAQSSVRSQVPGDHLGSSLPSRSGDASCSSGGAYTSKSIAELEEIRSQRAELVRRLELEITMLQQPSGLEERIESLEGAIELGEHPSMDPHHKAQLLASLLADLRHEHLHARHYQS